MQIKCEAYNPRLGWVKILDEQIVDLAIYYAAIDKLQGYSLPVKLSLFDHEGRMLELYYGKGIMPDDLLDRMVLPETLKDQ